MSPSPQVLMILFYVTLSLVTLISLLVHKTSILVSGADSNEVVYTSGEESIENKSSVDLKVETYQHKLVNCWNKMHNYAAD